MRRRYRTQRRRLDPNFVVTATVLERPDPDSFEERRCQNEAEIAGLTVRGVERERYPLTGRNRRREASALLGRHPGAEHVRERCTHEVGEVGKREAPAETIIRVRKNESGAIAVTG